MNMPTKPLENIIKINHDELIFLYCNSTSTIRRMVLENLLEKGVSTTRFQIDKELRTLKKTYNKNIIEETRRILKVVKGLEFNNQ